MKCSKCQNENPEKAKFCIKCGAPLEFHCPNCNAVTPPTGKFCMECGHNLKKTEAPTLLDYEQPNSYTPKHLADKILTNRSAIEGERKLVTVLFADVANFTAMSEKLDPEEVHQIMDGCFKILMEEIHKCEGTINQFTGDGVMALFGAPVAHEDHAQRACRAALAVQKAMVVYGERIKQQHDAQFQMRVGLNSGPVIVGAIGDDLRMDYTAVGDTTNLAARVEQHTEPGKVFLSPETRNIIRDYFESESVGEISLKGKSQPQAIYRLISEYAHVRNRFEAGLVRGVTELVGRRREISELQNAFEKVKTGEAQIVDVVGEAGVGKSRLAYEFRERLGEEGRLLTGLCMQYGGTINFLPVIDIVKAAFGIGQDMAEAEVGNRIAERAESGLARMVPFYRKLLSLKVEDPKFESIQPEGLKFGTFEAVKDLLISLSEEKPLVVFVEDIHWIDKISEEFFTFFSRCISEHRIMMFAAYRPEGTPPWAQGIHYQRLGLEALSAKSSEHLVHNILGGLTLEPALERRIVEKTKGNPFFVEEIIRELIDRGDISKEGNHYVSNRPIDQLQVPNTVQAVLAARMDRLNEDIKRTMQVASVIGRDFTFRILKSIQELGFDLKSHMSNLIGLEILYEKALYPELEYIFKHALTQEVAYNSLLKQRRRELHDRIGHTIENLYADRLDEHYEMLAHHYEKGSNAQKAINYLILAGEKSIQQYAVQSSYEFFKRAMEIFEDESLALEPQITIRLYQGWACANLGVGSIANTVKWHKKAVSLCRSHEMPEFEGKSLIELAFAMYIWPDREEATKFLNGAVNRAGILGNKALESRLLGWTCISESCFGSLMKAQSLALASEEIAREIEDPSEMIGARMMRSFPERWLGHPDKTIELTEGTIELIQQSFDFTMLSNTLWNRAVAFAETGRIEDSISLLNRGIGISEKYGPFYRHASFLNCLGYAYGEIHQTEKAWNFNLASDKAARELFEKYPMGRLQYAEIAAQARVNLMENLFDQGEIDESLKRLKAFEVASKNADYDMVRYIWESRMYCLASQILIEQNELDQAENMILNNLEEARKSDLKKRCGSFLRLLGEVQVRRNEFDHAIANYNNAIVTFKEVGNPRKLWEAHASLASAYEKMGRTDEARNQWGTAAGVIEGLANGLSDKNLREGFLMAEPVHRILSKAQS